MNKKSVLITVLVVLAVSAPGQCLEEIGKILGSDGSAGDSFGYSVSIDGDYAIIGAHFDDSLGSDSGSAYIFKRSCGGWIQQAKLTASNGSSGDYFGYSVSIDGDYAIIGAYGRDIYFPDSGTAYIFKRDGESWSQQAQLTAGSIVMDIEFGKSVSIDGDYCIVGAASFVYEGSAYIFKRGGTTWTKEATLTALAGNFSNMFGCSVSIDGEYAIIGDSFDDDNGNASGAAYVFKRESEAWSQQAKLLPSDGATYDSFGGSVYIDGDYAVIGASFEDENGTDSGSAYIFKREGEIWSEQAKLTASDGNEGDLFGRSVSIDSEYAIIGAYRDDSSEPNSGSAYLFKRDGEIWSEQVKLIASDGNEGDLFGSSVSIDGEHVIVGAFGDEDNGSYSGSAYIFGEIEELCIDPIDDFISSGSHFGPFTPECTDYTLTNNSPNTLDWEVIWTASWLDVSPNEGTLDSNTSTVVNACINTASLVPGVYADEITFANVTGGVEEVRAVELTILHPQRKLTVSDGEEFDRFGSSVSIDGDYAIIGAYGDDGNSSDSGTAFIFKRNGKNWTEQAKLAALDGADMAMFGRSVSIDGEYAIVGAYQDDDTGTDSGAAYIFKREDEIWSEQAKLTASDGNNGDWFGNEVSISADYVIVGAFRDDDTGISSGSAYIFKRDGESWIEQTKLTASDGEAYDLFGRSVSIDGLYAIVGAYLDDDTGTDSGAAYIFKRDGEIWSEQAKLTASDGNDGDFFGLSVSIYGDYAIIGACYSDDKDPNSGSAYIFRRDGEIWSEQTKLTASDGNEDSRFGNSVSIDGDNAIIGAYADDDNGYGSGSAYIFKRDGETWIEEGKLTASDGAEIDVFGCSVSIDGDYWLVGASGDDDMGSCSGSAYMFWKVYAGDLKYPYGVNSVDFAVLGDAWMSGVGDLNWDAGCDISEPEDEVIDWLDLGVFVGNWLEGGI